ncbi:MAG: hypothetical protein EOM14_07280 [Clostridia bacterium]|nr:hypothetical protein [Clostridia bacterium]
MVQTFLTGCDGKFYEMPVLLEWDFSYGDCLPCDAFEAVYVYDVNMQAVLSKAVRFKAVYDSKTVFFGVVDEYEIICDDSGCTVTVSGRSMAALLLDNEAEAAEYWSASLQTILNTYVYGCGITDVRTNVTVPNQALVVDSGSSCWKTLENFLWFGAKVRPRFSREGTLIIGAEKSDRLCIDSSTAVSAHRYRYRRYGVISEVLVKNKSAGTVSTVENADFMANGGCCRRVVTVPRKTRYDIMRATGEYQIACSKQDELRLSVTISALFAAFPGDVVELSDTVLGLNGCYTVGRTRCFADAKSAGTEIIITSREA